MIEKPLGLLEKSGTRRAVVIAFVVGVAILFLAFFTRFNEIYESHLAFKNLLDGFVVVSGLALAILEWRHSGEANEHRHELNRLTEEANAYRKETLELQNRVYFLQEEIERKLTKVRLYPRVYSAPGEIQLGVANLSGFDLWLNQVRLVVTQDRVQNNGGTSHVITGGMHLSTGKTESGFRLYGKLLEVYGNRAERMDVQFYVEIEAAGIADKPVIVRSPEYHLEYTHATGRKIRVIGYP